jgi:hypothetical protein
MEGPEAALRTLATTLREEKSVISDHVTDPADAEPALGLLVAAGPRAAEAPADYALLIESIREGYLLHYGTPRVLVGADDDLALLAGDYLYALGLERLAGIGDLEAIRELSDLISLSAQLHGDTDGLGEAEGADQLWLASVVMVAAGVSEEHEQAKSALRRGRPDAPTALWGAARHAAESAGLGDRLSEAAKAIGFQPH